MSEQEGYLIRGTKVRMPYPAKLTPGEIRLVFSLQKIFRPEMILADYYLPKADKIEMLERGKGFIVDDERLAQIDCLAVSEAGVFVFESKDYQGWIYGDGARKNWTQVLNFGKEKNQFYNPVKQNEVHVEAVKRVVKEEVPVYSVVVFGRQAELKVVENLPEGAIVCTQAGVYRAVQRVQKKIGEREMERVMGFLRGSGVRPTGVTRGLHVDEARRAAR